MSAARDPSTVTVQSILTRKVIDANGKELGRVSDLLAERHGDDLCVTHLIVGARAWIERFGPTNKGEGLHIPWERIDDLGPPIRLRRGRP